MTVEPSCKMYRETVPEVVEPYVHSDTSLIQRLVDSGSLSLDTRLQDIANAWNYGESIIHDVLQDTVRGALPELAVLLDALTEENKTGLTGRTNDEV